MSQQRSMKGTDILTTAVVIAAGTIAYGDIQFFDNSNGDFDWGLGPKYPGNGDPYLDQQFLDITRGALDQLGAVNPYSSPGWGYDQTYTAFRQEVYYDWPGYFTTAIYSYADLVVDGYFLVSLDAGTQIGGIGQSFYGSAFIAGEYYGDVNTLIPEDVRTYLGARIKVNYQMHYGWIGVIRTDFELNTFGWAYEDQPDTPIVAGAVPAPGTLAALVFGAGALGARRKKN